MSDVFILGAGFSKAISPEMPLLNELSREVRNRINFPLNSRIEDDVELWLTFLSQRHPWLSEADNLRNQALFIDISQEIAKILAERVDTVTETACPTWLSDLVSWWHDNSAEVITLNYDDLVEEVAVGLKVREEGKGQEWNLHYRDFCAVPLLPAAGRSGGALGNSGWPTFRLIKLHGSINWFYSGSQIDYGESIYYTSRGWGEKPEGDVAKRKWLRRQTEIVDKVPMIIPPVAEKTSYFRHETLRSLWSQAGKALRQAQRVYCLGYSFPKTDITMRFLIDSQLTQPGATFYVVNTDQQAKQHFTSVVSSFHEVDVRFVGEDPIRRLVEALVNGELDA